MLDRKRCERQDRYKSNSEIITWGRGGGWSAQEGNHVALSLTLKPEIKETIVSLAEIS